MDIAPIGSLRASQEPLNSPRAQTSLALLEARFKTACHDGQMIALGELSAALSEQLFQNGPVASLLVLAVATDGEVGMRGKPCQQIEDS